MNRYYRYPNIELWNEDAWRDRVSPITQLVKWVQTVNHEDRLRARATSPYAGRIDGVFNPKTGCNNLADVIQGWKDRGLTYYDKEIGGQRWIAMLPNEMVGRMGNDCEVLALFCDVDYKDPWWAMDALVRHEALLSEAARRHAVTLMIATDGWEPTELFVWLLQEAAPLYHLSYDRLYMVLSTLEAHGVKLSLVPGFTLEDADGHPVADPDAAVERWGAQGIPVMNIGAIWAHRRSIVYNLYTSEGFSDAAFDREARIHSATGRKVAEGLALEHSLRRPDDLALLARWREMGMRYEAHRTLGCLWHTFVPERAMRHPEEPIPLLILMHETGMGGPFETVTAYSYHYGWFELCAQGEFMLLIFALEDPEDNELLVGILEEAQRDFPIDARRVYITGHSHNGHYSMEFMRRHHEKIAAVATLGNTPGLFDPSVAHDAVKTDDSRICQMREYDMPVVNCAGYNESSSMFPLSADAPALRPNGRPALTRKFEDRARSWQRRLGASNCPMRTLDEIAATRSSADAVERKLGIPFDRTELVHLDGQDVYIGDVKNNAGRYHLRMICLDNQPHATPPVMLTLAWSFLRRFARDPETGACIELY